jgi:hypothetical protein
MGERYLELRVIAQRGPIYGYITYAIEMRTRWWWRRVGQVDAHTPDEALRLAGKQLATDELRALELMARDA